VRFLLTRLLSHTSQAEMVAQRIFPKPEQTELRRHLIQQINQADPAAYRAAMRSLAFFNTEHRLSEISAPVLVVTGEMDNTVPPETQKRLAKGLPHCEQITIDGCGHGATVEKPAEFNQILLEFIMIDP
jgi:3-oxoadipate enol-lactonase